MYYFRKIKQNHDCEKEGHCFHLKFTTNYMIPNETKTHIINEYKCCHCGKEKIEEYDCNNTIYNLNEIEHGPYLQ